MLNRIKKDCSGNIIKAYFFDSSFRLLLNYRIGRYCTGNKFLKLVSVYYRNRQLKNRSCQISYKSVIGEGVVFPHPIGIVIGEGVRIGKGVKIWQQVTIGSHGKNNKCLAYPIIGDNVKIFSGAKIFGDIKIGNDSVIGANAVVINDVPENSVAVGVPAKIHQRNI